MREFEHEQEPTLKYQNRKTSMATTAVLENWEPTTVLCPKCGGKHTAFNTMCVLTTYPEQYQYKCSDCGHRWTDYKAQPLGPIQSWPSLEYEDVTPIGQMGWICPKCGGVFAPHVNYCMNCTQWKSFKVTCVDLGGGSISGTGLGSVSDLTYNNVTTTQSTVVTKGELKTDGNKSSI
jgi:uncharacterized OB-fold protein